MASPIATGGAGIHLESRIAAYYLASVLTGGAVLGLPRGVAARQVELQRAALGQPLDDVIVHGQSSGGPSTLSLQVKRTLAFGNNELFKEVMAECWKTFKGADFREGVDRFGVAVGTPYPGVEKAGRNVFAWARESANAADFLTRMGIENFSSAGMREILGQLRGALDTAKGQPVTDQELWLFVRHLVVLYFDLDATDQSHSLVELTDRLRFALPAEDAHRAGDLWLALVDIADSAKPAAGSLDRPALISRLQAAFNFAIPRENAPTTISYLYQKSKYEPFYSVIRDVPHFSGDILNISARDGFTSIGLHTLHIDGLYRFMVRLWETTGLFYMLSAEPDETVFCLCPSAFGDSPITSRYKILPQDGEAAPVTRLHGRRTVFGLILTSPLKALPSTTDEPRLLSKGEIGALVSELCTLGEENWSARRYDYVVDFRGRAREL